MITAQWQSICRTNIRILISKISLHVKCAGNVEVNENCNCGNERGNGTGGFSTLIWEGRT